MIRYLRYLLTIGVLVVVSRHIHYSVVLCLTAIAIGLELQQVTLELIARRLDHMDKFFERHTEMFKKHDLHLHLCGSMPEGVHHSRCPIGRNL